MKIWRSIKQVHCTDGVDYRIERQICGDGSFLQCYVTQMDYEGSWDGSDAVLVWGKYESTVNVIGYSNVYEAVSKLNSRLKPENRFRPI